jgi:PAS domain S-box-containing protein
VTVQGSGWHQRLEREPEPPESTRARVFRALYEIAVAVGGMLEPAELARVVAERACELLAVDGVAVYISNDAGTRLLPLHSSDATEREPESPLPAGQGAAGQAYLRGEPVAVSDYADWPNAGPWGRDQGVAAALAVPLRVADRCTGALSVRTYTRRDWSDEDTHTLSLLAAQVAPSLEAARLFERTQVEALEREVVLAREQLSRERLELALEAGHMGTWDFDTRTRTVSFSPQMELIHGFEPGAFSGGLEAYLARVHPEDVERVRAHLNDSLQRGVLDLEYRAVAADGQVRWFEARGRAVRDASGNVVEFHGVCQDVTERVRLMHSEQVALEAKAALEERQRLARELHDSVSQALYGITLGAQTALEALSQDASTDAAVNATRYVLGLAEAGLAELRALIFELRPESLAQEGLVAALERQVAATRAGASLEVTAELGSEPNAPLVVKEALYRIAREGLHNVVKHARAHTVRVSLAQSDGRLELEIVDDGDGFDPTATYPGHLGLTSMRERARGIGGDLQVSAAPGQGTALLVRAPLHPLGEGEG